MKGKNLALMLLFLAAAALAFLVGRYLGNRQETPGSSAVSEAVSSGNSEPQSGPESSESPEPAAPANLRGEFADSGTPVFSEGGEDRVLVLLTTDAAVTDFRFVVLSAQEAEDGVRFEVGETLYSQDVLTPEAPVLLETVFAGMLPDQGIVYTDTDGTEKRFALTISGEDGSLILMAID